MMGICLATLFQFPTVALKPAFRLETQGGTADRANDRTT
jgi:hypothetical protein